LKKLKSISILTVKLKSSLIGLITCISSKFSHSTRSNQHLQNIQGTRHGMILNYGLTTSRTYSSVFDHEVQISHLICKWLQ